MTIESQHVGSQPWLHQKGEIIQEFGTVKQFPLGLSYETRMYSCQRLNKVLADAQILYGLYKKHHWLMRGRPSTNSTWSWTSTRENSWNSSTPSPSASRPWAVSPWAIPGTSPRSRRSRALRMVWRRSRRCSRGCWRPTRPS